jgi:hypothetical protein
MTNNEFTDWVQLAIKIITFYYVGVLTRNILTKGEARHDGFFRTVLNIIVGALVVGLLPYVIVAVLCIGTFVIGFTRSLVDAHFKNDNAAKFQCPVAYEELFTLGCYDTEHTGHACFCEK